MGTVLVLVERPQAQGADVACDVVAGGDGVVLDGVGADEADFDVAVAVGGRVLRGVLDLELEQLAGLGGIRLLLGCGRGRGVLLLFPSSRAPPSAAAAASSAPCPAPAAPAAVARGSRLRGVISSVAAVVCRSHAGSVAMVVAACGRAESKTWRVVSSVVCEVGAGASSLSLVLSFSCPLVLCSVCRAASEGRDLRLSVSPIFSGLLSLSLSLNLVIRTHRAEEQVSGEELYAGTSVRSRAGARAVAGGSTF